MRSKYLTIPTLETKELERFWAKIDKHGPLPEQKPELGSCWIWIGAGKNDGYGNLKIKERYYQAHRVAFFLYNQRLPPPGLFVLHKCDRRRCCNPLHLEEGSHALNMEQAKERGRMAKGERHSSVLHPESVPRGENHSRAIFNEEMVILLRNRYRNDKTLTIEMLAKEYQMNRGGINHVLAGTRWGHIPGALSKEEMERTRRKRGPYKRK